MAKKTRPKLTAELQQKYNAWLRQQKGAGGIGYITGDDEAGAPVASSDVEAESVQRWLRETNSAAAVEYGESDEAFEEEKPEPAATRASLIDVLISRVMGADTRTLLIAAAVIAVAAGLVALVWKG